MCGRYYVPEDDDNSGFREIFERLTARHGGSNLLAVMKRGEVFPSDIAPVVVGGEPLLMKWGFSSPAGKGLVINARLETAAERPMFSRLYANQRCLIPAACYFEWRRNGGQKRKYAICQGTFFYIAGLYRKEQGSPVMHFVILTRPAAPSIEFIHDRMPVILTGDACREWLDGKPLDAFNPPHVEPTFRAV